MFTEKITSIEKKIEQTPAIDQPAKDELLELLDNLNEELSKLEDNSTNMGHSQEIVGKASRFAEQAIADPGATQEIEQSINELKGSVADFEASHPKLVQIINRVCVMLSDIGI